MWPCCRCSQYHALVLVLVLARAFWWRRVGGGGLACGRVHTGIALPSLSAPKKGPRLFPTPHSCHCASTVAATLERYLNFAHLSNSRVATATQVFGVAVAPACCCSCYLGRRSHNVDATRHDCHHRRSRRPCFYCAAFCPHISSSSLSSSSF